MSDSVNPSPEPATPPPAVPSHPGPDKKALRRRTVQFVVVFIVSVFALLFGYESAKMTKPNDWYLLQVARSTAFLLRHLGHSCTLGNADVYRGKKAQVRAGIEALRRGEDFQLSTLSTTAATPGAEPPLTPWEAWEFEAACARNAIAGSRKELERLEADTSLKEPDRAQRIDAARTDYMQLKQRDRGPRVGFILQASPNRLMTEAAKRLDELKEDRSLSENVRAERVAQTEAEIKQYREEMDALQNAPPEEQKRHRELVFNFVVIPDCGAVQSMAIFFSAILAFPARWWKRIAGMVVGIPILYWINAVRLAVLAVIGAWDNGGKWFKFTHEYIWQGIYIVFVVALWMAWVEFLVKRRNP